MPTRDRKRLPGPLRRPGKGSFSLIEVMIAIAVIVFVVIAVLGLMAYASRLTQQSDTYSRLAQISGQVLARLNSQPFAVSTNNVATNTVYYFTVEGLPTNSAGAYYQCRLANANPPGWGLTNLMQIQLIIRWPSPLFNNTNVIVTSTLNYD